MDEFDVVALKKAHENARKKAQYARQAAKQRKTREGVQRYKELYPALFAKLQAQAQQELEGEFSNTQTPTIVFTGSLSITRDKASHLAENAGYKVSNHVSKSTTYIVVGESPGSKLHKAAQLGIDVLDEADFHALLKGEKPAHVHTTTCSACGHKLTEAMGRFARISGGFTCPKCHTQNRF